MPRLVLRVLLPLLSVLTLSVAAGAQEPADAEARRAAAEGHLVRAMTEHFLGNDSAAVRLLTNALCLAPGDAAVLDALAEAHAALGDPTAALYHAEAAVRAAPDRPSLHLHLGRLQLEAGMPDAAEASLQSAHRLAPQDPEPLVALAALYGASGRDAEEEETLRALIAVGDTPAARLRLADLAATRGDTARAVALLDAAIRMAPGEPALRTRRDALVGTPAAPARPAPALSDDTTAPAAPASVEALLARVDAEPGDLAAWTRLLDTLAATGDPRGVQAADDAVLFFPASPGVLAPAAELYLAADRTADAEAAARAGIAALDSLGAPSDALRSRLQRVLDR